MSAASARHQEANLRISPSGGMLPPGTIDRTMEKLFPSPSQYMWDPVGWAKAKVKAYLWSKQIEILEALKTHRKVAVQSCHGPGKTFTASVAGAWWLDPETHPLGSAMLVTTAPSWDQVEKILWKELRRRHRQAGLRGRITLDCVWHMGEVDTKRADPSEEIIGMGRKPADYDEDTFQGIHARYFMAILDEAGGIPEALWNGVLSLATNENARILAIGNPDDPGSRFAQVCRPGSDWHVIKVSVWDTPNFTPEVIEKYREIGAVPEGYTKQEAEYVPEEVSESLVSPLYVDTAISEWGIGSPIWIAKVNGEFPDISDEYLISPALIAKAQQNTLSGLASGRYGMDVARFGHDKSVIYLNRGGQIRLAQAWGKKDTMESAGIAARWMRSHGIKRWPMVIDIIGLGSGVFDRLKELRLAVAPHQGSTRAANPGKFKNRRSEVWWTFRELMEDLGIDLDPADLKLAAELGSVKWGTDSAGRIYIETKEDMEKRGLPSPNHGDAAVLSTVAPMRLVMEDPKGESASANSITGDLLKRVM